MKGWGPGVNQHGEGEKMPAYVIAQIEIENAAGYQAYLDGFSPIFERYDARLLVSSRQDPETVEGNWPLRRAVVIEFRDMAEARAWYDDPDYQSLIHHRWNNARTNMIFVEGYVDPDLPKGPGTA